MDDCCFLILPSGFNLVEESRAMVAFIVTKDSLLLIPGAVSKKLHYS